MKTNKQLIIEKNCFLLQFYCFITIFFVVIESVLIFSVLRVESFYNAASLYEIPLNSLRPGMSALPSNRVTYSVNFSPAQSQLGIEE